MDDNPTNQDILKRRLEKHGFNCMLADNGNQALAIIEEHEVDLVLLDLLMPDMNGIEVLHAIRSTPGRRELPIIIVSGLNDARGIAKCLSHGATDYLAKPVEPLILDAKVVSALERFAYRRELNMLATTDQLTQLMNRRAVMARLDEIVEQYFAEEVSFGMLLLDIDFFKKVNDTYGHNGGDAVLTQFAECLKNVMRSTDVIGRMGGEEFIAIVQNTSVQDFHNICERIRTSVEALSCDHEGLIIKITTSGGTYFSSELETNVKEMINIADQRLYGAKKAGAIAFSTPIQRTHKMAHILIVEDNELNRDMLSRRLERRGFEVSIAVDGQEGLDMIKSKRPDLVLMDMDLPIIDGWEATRQAKNDSDISAIPIIALTAHALAEHREQAEEAGANDFDTKPIEMPRL